MADEWGIGGPDWRASTDVDHAVGIAGNHVCWLLARAYRDGGAGLVGKSRDGAIFHRRPNAANAAGVRPVDWITPAFAEYLTIPDPEVGSKYWEIGTSGPGYLWPPRQLDPGQQLARMMLASPNAFEGRFLAHEAAAGVYLEEGVRRALEDNQRQIAEAEQRQREREEREQAESKAAAEADRAAWHAKYGWPT